MCTAVRMKNGDTYFGRNLDLERGYGERVVITPRNYVFPMRRMKHMESHYALVGMAAVVENVPLYFDATNEKGLSMAGLNFPGNAYYGQEIEGKDNVAPFELIPWILGQCADIAETRRLLENLNLSAIPFSLELPQTPLHWMIGDRNESIVVESMCDGLKVWENSFDVLTNNPPFNYHAINMSNYMSLHAGPSAKMISRNLPLENYSLGMGALGLPGDFSSISRFVRAVYVKEQLHCGKGENESVGGFFHMLNSVAMPKGCVWTENGYEYTRYSSCCNVDKGIYYYTTYEDFCIRSMNMWDVDLNGSELIMEKIS